MQWLVIFPGFCKLILPRDWTRAMLNAEIPLAAWISICAKSWDCETLGTVKWSRHISLRRGWKPWNSQACEAVQVLMALCWLCISGSGDTENFDFQLNFTLKVKVNHLQNNRDLNQGTFHLWSKFGNPSLNGWWVIVWTIFKLKSGKVWCLKLNLTLKVSVDCPSKQ